VGQSAKQISESKTATSTKARCGGAGRVAESNFTALKQNQRKDEDMVVALLVILLLTALGWMLKFNDFYPTRCKQELCDGA
jgi:hypothetical protein